VFSWSPVYVILIHNTETDIVYIYIKTNNISSLVFTLFACTWSGVSVSQVLSCFKTLHRARKQVFDGDVAALSG